MSATTRNFLLAPDTRLTCPQCEHEFALTEGFAKKALETVEEASGAALATLREQERNSSERQSAAIARERELAHEKAMAQVRLQNEQTFTKQLEPLKAQLAEKDAALAAIAQRENAVTARERTLETRVQEAAAARAAELVAGERQSYEKQLAESRAQLQTLKAEQLALREERQKLRDEKDALALEVRKQVDAKLIEREALVRNQEQEKSNLEKAELHKTIDDMTAKLAEAQAKGTQGSQQLQGEVLELAIEERLRSGFPLDTIEEVKKGQRGGDVLQHVMTRTGQTAGTILWEMKRAKEWGTQWTSKLKEDMRGASAAVGVLVTMPGALPKDWPANAPFALYEDVWVTQLSTALPLADVLRVGLIDVHRQRMLSAGKGEKMEAVYDYLTSPQFAQKLRAVYETFTRMREELDTEKNVTQQRWARREKQLQLGAQQLLGIGGEIQGLAQESLPLLELHQEAAPRDGS